MAVAVPGGLVCATSQLGLHVSRIIKDRIRGRSSELCGASGPDSLSPVWVNAGNVMLWRTSSPFLL